MNSELKLALLVVRQSNQQYFINKFAVAVGRGAGNDIIIPRDALVSRHHVVFLFVNGRTHIQDIGSRNGTIVNGKMIPSFQMMELHSGDEIYIGTTKFSFLDLGKDCTNKNSRVPDTVPLNKAQLDKMPKPEPVAILN